MWSDEKACVAAERVLDALVDGEWHYVIGLMACVSPTKLAPVLEFFAEYKFIEWDREANQVRLDHAAITFLRKIFETKSAKWKKRAKC